MPTFYNLYIYNSNTIKEEKTRINHFQELILGNISIGLNQHVNNYEGITISQFGTSLSLFVQQIEIGVNYSIDMGSTGPVGTDLIVLNYTLHLILILTIRTKEEITVASTASSIRQSKYIRYSYKRK